MLNMTAACQHVFICIISIHWYVSVSISYGQCLCTAPQVAGKLKRKSENTFYVFHSKKIQQQY